MEENEYKTKIQELEKQLKRERVSGKYFAEGTGLGLIGILFGSAIGSAIGDGSGDSIFTGGSLGYAIGSFYLYGKALRTRDRQ